MVPFPDLALLARLAEVVIRKSNKYGASWIFRELA
jgi:hypothetical protein